MHKPLLILKLGTSSIIKSDGSVNVILMDEVAEQFNILSKRFRLLLVSSGAVGFGRLKIKGFRGKINERKAAAAIGNPILIAHYSNAFSKYNLEIAQTLCERSHFSNRAKFLQLRETLETLWDNGIVPIANENDVVSSHELKFSDNDELATLIAVGFGAKHLLIGTSVDGLLDKNGKVVREISTFTDEIMNLATGEKSAFGLGGMISKITFARLASSMGIKVSIFRSTINDGISAALEGEIGTQCLPKKSSKDARQKWLASGSLVSGKVIVDIGAEKALKKRNSLLSVGIIKIKTSFNKGEVFEILSEQSKEAFAVARAKISSEELKSKLKENNIEVAHTDDIVIL